MSEQVNWTYGASWLVDKRVCLIEISGELDDQRVIEFNTHIRDEYLEKGEAPVHIIMDAQNLVNYPRNVTTLRKASAISTQHPNTGWVCLVGFDNSMLRFLGSAIAQLLGLKFKQMNTLEEAVAVLRSVDSSLTDQL